MTKTLPRFMIVGLAAIPVAALFTAEVLLVIFAGLDFDNQTVPLIQVQLAAGFVFLGKLAALIYWAAGETASVRRAVSRTCWAFAIAAFLLPIALLTWGVTAPPDPPGTIFSTSFVLMVYSIIGVILGAVGLALAVGVSPPGSPERSPERLFREIGGTVRRIGGVRIGVALMLLIIGVVVLRVGSTSGFWSEKYTAIATNGMHTCGIRTDGTAHCWGYSRAIPPVDEKFVAIAPGGWHACGLREDGSVSCWGDIISGFGPSLNADPGIDVSKGPFLEIRNGGNHICALRPDGTVVCWGKDLYGYGATSPPDGELFTGISAGRTHTCGLRPDGTGICWGSIDSPPGNEHFKTISSGVWDFACGIRVEEDIFCWGFDLAPTGREGPFVALSSGSHHACGLRPDGSVHCWRASAAHETYNLGSDPVRGEKFVSISIGGNYNCGLRHNGTAKCWGGNWLNNRYR